MKEQKIYSPDEVFLYLSFPVLIEPDYPEWVYEKAENLAVSAEDIVMPGNVQKVDRFGTIWIHRELCDPIPIISQSVLNENYSVIELTDGRMYVVVIPHLELVKRIEYFVQLGYDDEESPEGVKEQKLEKDKIKAKNEIRG